MNAPVTLVPAHEDISFQADVATLKGRLFRPGGVPRAAAVIHPATGVPARYYHAFGKWLAARGVACLTYDYRDFGASATRHVRTSDTTLVRWGIGDQTAAQWFLERAFPGVPLWVIGHSIGGMMLPFQPRADRVDRLITVASGPVHLSDHSGVMKALARLFWYGHAPLAVRALGYLPGKALGLGADLPAGVYWQWRRWCTTRGFYLSDVGRLLPVPDWKRFNGEMRCVAVADDTMVPPAASWRLMQSYPEARKTQAVLRPVNGTVGHIAAFAERNRGLWPEIIGEAR